MISETHLDYRQSGVLSISLFAFGLRLGERVELHVKDRPELKCIVVGKSGKPSASSNYEEENGYQRSGTFGAEVPSVPSRGTYRSGGAPKVNSRRRSVRFDEFTNAISPSFVLLRRLYLSVRILVIRNIDANKSMLDRVLHSHEVQINLKNHVGHVSFNYDEINVVGVISFTDSPRVRTSIRDTLPLERVMASGLPTYSSATVALDELLERERLLFREDPAMNGTTVLCLGIIPQILKEYFNEKCVTGIDLVVQGSPILDNLGLVFVAVGRKTLIQGGLLQSNEGASGFYQLSLSGRSVIQFLSIISPQELRISFDQEAIRDDQFLSDNEPMSVSVTVSHDEGRRNGDWIAHKTILKSREFVLAICPLTYLFLNSVLRAICQAIKVHSPYVCVWIGAQREIEKGRCSLNRIRMVISNVLAREQLASTFDDYFVLIPQEEIETSWRRRSLWIVDDESAVVSFGALSETLCRSDWKRRRKAKSVINEITIATNGVANYDEDSKGGPVQELRKNEWIRHGLPLAAMKLGSYRSVNILQKFLADFNLKTNNTI